MKRRRLSPKSSSCMRIGEQMTNLTKRLPRKELSPELVHYIVGLTTYAGLSLGQTESAFEVLGKSIPALQNEMPSKASIQKVNDSLPVIAIYQFSVIIYAQINHQIYLNNNQLFFLQIITLC